MPAFLSRENSITSTGTICHAPPLAHCADGAHAIATGKGKVERVMNELEILKAVDHPFVVTLIII
jgi:hypothetical protein